MKLPNQAKPISRVMAAEVRPAHGSGTVRPADFLDDLLRGITTGTQIAGQIGQTLLPLLPLLL